MNSAMNNKRNNTILFVFAMVASIGMVSGSGVIVSKLISGQPGKFLEVAKKTCLTNLKTSGFSLDLTMPNEIRVTRSIADGVEAVVYSAGVAVASCPAHEITEFCAGTGCKTDGVSFTLKTKEAATE